MRNFTGDYDTLLELVKTRVSVRNLKPDRSRRLCDQGPRSRALGNVGCQRPAVGFRCGQGCGDQTGAVPAYIEENSDFIYWMEQQRDFKLRHPSYQMTHDEALQKHRTGVGWSIAPVLIVILGDGRRQWATCRVPTPSGATSRT